MLTNNTITNIDPGEWLSLPLSMVPEPVQEHVLQAKCPAADYPCGVTNDHQGAKALCCSHTKYCVASTRNHHFPFFFKFLHRQPFASTDPTLTVFTEQPSYYHVLIMTCVKSGCKMKRSLKTIYHWRQRGFGGRCDINVHLLKPLGVHSCLIAERVIFLDCISLGIKRTTGAYLMRGYFTSRSIQSHSGNMLQLCCKPRVLQACTFAVGFKTIYFK